MSIHALTYLTFFENLILLQRQLISQKSFLENASEAFFNDFQYSTIFLFIYLQYFLKFRIKKYYIYFFKEKTEFVLLRLIVIFI